MRRGLASPSLRCSVAAVAASAALTVGSASPIGAPHGVAPSIETKVEETATPSTYRYTYTIGNGAQADARITRVQFEAGRVERVPAGWAVRFEAFSAGDSSSDRLSLSASQEDSGIAPGRTVNGFVFTSPMLPGVAKARVFAAAGSVPWDEPLPLNVTSIPIIGPTIGSSEDEPFQASREILRAIKVNLLPSLEIDRDADTEHLDRALDDVLIAIAQRNTTAAESLMQTLLVEPRESGSSWRGALHDALHTGISYVLDLMAHPDETRHTRQRATRFPTEALEEVWIDPGLPPPSPRDLTQFFAGVDAVFVGRVESKTAEFVDKAERDCRTRIVFRPTEILRGSPVSASVGTVDVWARGGAYVKGDRVPTRVADAAKDLFVGSSYLVAAKQFIKNGSALNGQYWLAAPDTLARIEDGHVAPTSLWIESVLKQGRASPAADGLTDDATRFLEVLRRAARGAVK